jgi:hypothetical protein
MPPAHAGLFCTSAQIRQIINKMKLLWNRDEGLSTRLERRKHLRRIGQRCRKFGAESARRLGQPSGRIGSGIEDVNPKKPIPIPNRMPPCHFRASQGAPRCMRGCFENSTLRSFGAFEPWRLAGCLTSKTPSSRRISKIGIFFMHLGAPKARGLLL